MHGATLDVTGPKAPVGSARPLNMQLIAGVNRSMFFGICHSYERGIEGRDAGAFPALLSRENLRGAGFSTNEPLLVCCSETSKPIQIPYRISGSSPL